MTVAESIAEWLHEKEINHIFGIVGAGNLPLWEAISRKAATQIVCCHHEQAAAMAASFYQRTSGRIAVCLVTTGAGSTNAITGVMAAYMDSTPLLVLSGNETAESLWGGTRVLGVQGYDSSGLATRFTKRSRMLARPSCLPAILDDALEYSTNGRPGPVWIDIPRDVQNEAI